MRKLSLLSLCALILNGCASGYRQESFWRPGYSDYRLTQDTFSVSFSGNRFTSPEQIEQYALRRASQLTLDHGFTHFVLLLDEEQAEWSAISIDQEFLDRYTDLSNPVWESHAPRISLKIRCYKEDPPTSALDASDFLAYTK